MEDNNKDTGDAPQAASPENAPPESASPEAGTPDNSAENPAAESGADWPPKLSSEEPPVGEVAIPEDDSGDGASSDEGASTEANAEAAEIDPQQAAAELEQRQPIVISLLFGHERPRPGEAHQTTAEYAALVAAARVDPAEHLSAFMAQLQTADQEAVTDEKEKFAKVAEAFAMHVDNHEQIYAALAQLVASIASEVEALSDDEAHAETPEKVQETLANYRQGIEIVQRMLTRANDRKKDLGMLKPSLHDNWSPQESVVEGSAVDASLLSLSNEYHKVRDNNYHAIQDARDAAEKCRQASLAALKTILTAVDGIDSGLASEAEVRSSIAEYEEDEKIRAVIEKCFGAYQRLADHTDKFFDAAGIEAHTVPAGTPFDPSTMEPQGTVENPELNNEDVAEVLRRGFSLRGELIRPMVVDVVRNP